MPVLRSIKTYHRSTGIQRFVRLYGSYCNMNARIRGQVRTGRGGAPIWAGLECDFESFDDFRAWALANGYGRERCSLDRKDSRRGYLRTNLRWVTKLENSTYANLIGGRKARERSKVFKGETPFAYAW